MKITFRFKLLLTFVVTALFIGGIEYYIGFASIFTAWKNLSPAVLLFALLLTFFSYCLRAMRIYSYFSLKQINHFALCVKTTLLHNFLNNLLPLRSGEISLPVMLKNYFDIKTLDAVVALLFFRILDLHVLGLTLLGAGLFLFPDRIFLILFFTIFWLVLPFVILKFRLSLERSLNAFSENKFAMLLQKLISSFPNSRLQLVTAYWWTLINWLIKLMVLSWVVLQFYPMEFPAALVGVIFGDASSVLPIHGVAGIGTYEAGVVIGTGLLDVDAKSILPAAINLHLFVLGASGLAALFALLIPHAEGKESEKP